MKILSLAVVVVLGIGGSAGAQPGPAGGPPGPRGGGDFQRGRLPPRDNLPTPTGTSRILGRVVATDTGSPLRLAQVRLSSPELRLTRVATTNAEGRYEFSQLPSGRYSIAVSKAGYVMLQFGQAGIFDPGKPVEVGEGQAMNGIDFSLPRGSVITGRVSDAYGDPIAQAQVVASRYQYGQNGQRRLANVMSMGSDDLGQFRIYGLPPGEYIVSATVRVPMMMPSTDAGSQGSASEGYAPTYFPGVQNAAEAQPVTVGVGQEVSAFFQLLTTRMSRVTGTVIDSEGLPVTGGVIMMTTGSGTGFGGGPAAQVRSDGSFTIGNVPPGQHTLNFRSQGRRPGSDFASVPIVVAGEDVTGVQMVTSRGATVSGHMTFRGSAPKGGPVTIVPSSVDQPGMGTPFGGPQANGRVDADGRFEMRGLFGKVVFRATAPPGWAMTSVTLNGDDITDVPYDLKGDVSGLEVTMTDRITQISGTIKDSRGQTVKDYVVVLVPADVKEGTVPGRFVRSARPDQDGRFLVKGMPPGEYVAAALDKIEPGREWDPEFQTRLRAKGQSFSLTDGQSKTLDLELAKP